MHKYFNLLSLRVYSLFYPAANTEFVSPCIFTGDNRMIPVALIDDHVLFRNALASYIQSIGMYSIHSEATDGQAFIDRLQPDNIPSIIVLDVLMQGMNGFDTAKWINRHYPKIKIIAVSMLYDESTIIRMLRNGASGYVRKDADLTELKNAMEDVLQKGMYINGPLYQNFLPTIQHENKSNIPDYRKAAALNSREKEFLRCLCTGMPYKQIAAIMYVSPRTIDGYRDTLFEKLQVSSRTGLVMFAIRNHIAEP